MNATILHSLVLLIPVLPLLAALWIGLGAIFKWNRGEASERETAYLAVGSGLLVFLLLLALDIYSLLQAQLGTVVISRWLESGNIQASFSLLFDGLSLTLATVFSFIILLTLRFSVNYLHRESSFQRFFMIMCVFHAAMLLIVLGGNLMVTFIGWELAGISSYLLISYSWQREYASTNATRAFVTNRIGDAGFILAIFIALVYWGTCDWEALLVQSQTEQGLVANLIVLGLMLAACVKSAQFPFSAWITHALEGPTPSSAVFYGSVMVHAGIYLLLRLSPMLEQMPIISWLLAAIGLATVIYAWFLAQVQTDIKSSLIFSTLMQVGLMLMEIAAGWTTLALIHLVLHALWRIYQFLLSPSFLQQTTSPAPAAPAWFQKSLWLHNACLQRFWLDRLADTFLVHPTRLLAHEAQLFDQQVVDRLTGTPSQVNMLSTLAQMQALQSGTLQLTSQVGVGSGVFGKLMQRIAEMLEWFEERLVLKSSSEGIGRLATVLGRYASLMEHYLQQPRYMLVLVAATLVVVL
jgi:NADH:ubiquinone oxidoreductase subunit 5 (subunit L)/multisubunit Na+/H+ antiporter MnhA subunit